MQLGCVGWVGGGGVGVGVTLHVLFQRPENKCSTNAYEYSPGREGEWGRVKICGKAQIIYLHEMKWEEEGRRRWLPVSGSNLTTLSH